MTTLHVCLCEFAGKPCGGRVVWTRSTAGGFAGSCSRCRDQRRAVSSELPVLEQLEADGALTPKGES